MKVLLISIDLVLGTRILISMLRSKKFVVKNLQIIGLKYSDVFSKKTLQDIYEFSKEFDVVGLSFNSFYSVLAAQLGEYLKSKGVRWIIAGGPHVTAKPEDVMAYSDIAVIYEAEITLPKLLERLNTGNSFCDIKGLVFRNEEGRIINTGCPEIEDKLDSIPLQSISSKDIRYYNFKNKSFQEPTIGNLFPHGGRNYFIMTSRGCPFNCAYCCNNLFAKINKKFTKIRKRSIQNIISEMRIAKQMGFGGFYVVDDNFLAFTKEEIESFSELYRSGINLPFGLSGINPNNLRLENSKEKIEALLKCGLSDVRIGVQSGSNKTLKIFNRRYTTEELPKLLDIFDDRRTIWRKPGDKLRVAIDFICDAPWEEEKDKVDTLKLANNLLTRYGVFFYTLIYLPGTDIYELALKEKWFADAQRDIYLRGIAGVEDNIYNRLFFLIAVLKERGSKVSEEIIEHILRIHKENAGLAEELIDSIIKAVNNIEEHHGVTTAHLTLHPYLKGFNRWTKTAGDKGKKVLFRSYHEPYG
jgi:radical SAM superfamily enzyme YgiQ (UPF0313 family)